MELAFIDLEKQQAAWEVFTAPLYEVSQPYVKLAQLGPDMFGNDVCNPGDDCMTVNGDRLIKQDPDINFNLFTEIREIEMDQYVQVEPVAPDGGETEDKSEEKKKCEAKQGRERMRDFAARRLEAGIREKDDWNEIEYGAVIYSGPAGTRIDLLDTGTTDNVDWTIDTREGETVVGLVHSHPSNSYTVPSPDDWAAADQAIAKHGGDLSNFSHYILDFDTNKLYEYDGTSERSPDGRADGTQTNIDDANSNCNSTA